MAPQGSKHILEHGRVDVSSSDENEVDEKGKPQRRVVDTNEWYGERPGVFATGSTGRVSLLAWRVVFVPTALPLLPARKLRAPLVS
jgi:hypothetical protein